MDEYEKCDVCGAVLVRNVMTDAVYCKLCGYSRNKESDISEPSYIG